MIDDAKFQSLTKEVYERIMSKFEDFDPDIAEADFHLDNICITFHNKIKFIVNRQPPVKQIWLATKRQGLHFNFDEASNSWINDKSGEEFYEVFSKNVSEILGEKFTMD